MKFKTIYDGEKAVVVDRNGKKDFYDGPKRIFLFMEKMEKLRSYVADEKQYLIIKFVSGAVKHMRGPCMEWFNRFEHESITVKDLYQLNSSEIIIVYKRDSQTTTVDRRLCEGPCMFMPHSNEWIHEFNWHVMDHQNIGHLIKNDLKFEILTKKPDFFHYYVKEVRTIDDTLITVKLMVIFQVEEIFTMLDRTQDPISDFINAICADVVSFVGQLTFVQFVHEGASKLNQIETYEQLATRASRTGYKIDSIIYNGYMSSEALQQIQDNAIHARTKLRLDAELAEQNNRLIDLRLSNQNKCMHLESELNKLQVEFDQKLLDSKAKFDLSTSKSSHNLELQLKDIEHGKQVEVDTKKRAIDETFLNDLSEIGVDVSKYEIEVAKSKNKIDKIYELID